MSRAAKYTALSKTPVYYVDFLDTFDINPLTGLLAAVQNESSVTQSIKNLILTGVYERYEQPLVGSKINALLFENYTPVVRQNIINEITQTINNHEPRATVIGVEVDFYEATNSLRVSVVYSLINIPQNITFSLILTRVR